MLPTAVIEQARKQGLDAIGVCDHNSAENVGAVRKAGERSGLHVLGGMEITSREEVHVLAFFEDDHTLAQMQSVVYDNLSGENNETFFGTQYVVDENDNVVGTSMKLLIGATSLSIDDTVRTIRRLGGVAIASHVDRETFSLIGQLGFVPATLPLNALELSPNWDRTRLGEYERYGLPLVMSSDAHFLADIGKAATTFYLESFCVAELALALSGREGRKVVT
jgi:predicted metal-dependent phosphoesterase TrpH